MRFCPQLGFMRICIQKTTMFINYPVSLFLHLETANDSELPCSLHIKSPTSVSCLQNVYLLLNYNVGVNARTK